MSRNRVLLVGVVALIILVMGIKVYANSKARSEVDKAVEKVSRFVQVEYGNVKGKVFGSSAVVNAVRIVPAVGSKVQGVQEEIRVDRIEASGSGFDQEEAPKSLFVSFQGIEMDIEDMEPPARQIMRALDYEGVMRVNLKLEFDYDRKEKHLSLHNLSLGMDELGELGMSVDLKEIVLDKDNLGSLLFSWPWILVSDLQIGYEDDSFLPRVMEYAAKQEGMSWEELRRELTSGIEREVRVADSEFARDSLERLREFAEDPKRISISASPEDPQSVGKIMRIQRLEDLIELLNVRVKL